MGQDLSKERERMVQGLVQEGLLKSLGVIAAIGRVQRELFVPEHIRRYAYDDTPLPTEHGQTISAPHGMICRALHGRHNE
jgi:protein-L-isoaspartate(D-aspartate) O-methyltransferase